jgi:hypothetical protein
MPPHAAKISDVSNLFAQIIFFILTSKPLKLFNVNTNHFHTMFKALKLFSLNLLKIAHMYFIFVAKIMATYISRKV